MGNGNVDKASARETTAQAILDAMGDGIVPDLAPIETKLDTLHTDNGSIETLLTSADTKLDTLHTDNGSAGAAPTGSGILGWLSGLYTKLTNIDLHTPALGQSTASGSSPVVLNSDPDQRVASADITIQDTGSTSTPGQNSSALVTGTPTANSFQKVAINGRSSAKVLVTGTWTGTLTFELSIDSGTSWTPITARVKGSSYYQASVTGNGLFYTDVADGTNFRVRATGAMTGTAHVTFAFTSTSGATEVLNPIRMVDNASGNALQIAATGAAFVGGEVASGVADVGNPTKIGGKYNTSAPTLTNGNRGDVQLDSNANLKNVEQFSPVYEDNTVGVARIEERFNFTNITTNATTIVKSGAGLLKSITINTVGATDTITVYDNTAGSGTKIATINAAGGVLTLHYNVTTSTGVTIVTAGTTAPDITVSWR